MKKIDNNVLQSDFGEWIRSERERLGLSQERVAAELHLHQTYYGKIELAKRGVDLSTALAICNVLGLDLSDFIKTHM